MTANEMALKPARLLVEPQLEVLGHRARARAVVERHHEDGRRTPSPGSRRPSRSGWSSMPYLAPEAAMPMTSCAPRFAEMKARPAIQAGMERPERKKSSLLLHVPAQRQADAEHEDEVDDQDGVVDPAELYLRHGRSSGGWAGKGIGTSSACLCSAPWPHGARSAGHRPAAALP